MFYRLFSIRVISPYVTAYGVEFILKNAHEDADIELITGLSISTKR